jgi:hypothetical protein
MQHMMIAPRISAAPMSEPMTMPAMAPPESLEPDPLRPAGLDVPVGAAEEVDENRGGIDEVTGNSTPTQRASTLALTQHESVEFGELAPQNMQRLWRLEPKPHSLGSFSTASVQSPLSERGTCWHLSESDRI